MTIPLAIAAVIGLLLALGAVVCCVLDGMLLARIRNIQPDVWEALGAPNRIFDDGGAAALEALRRFYRTPELWQRCSPDVTSFARLTRLYTRVYLGCAVVGFIVLAVWLWTTTWASQAVN